MPRPYTRRVAPLGVDPAVPAAPVADTTAAQLAVDEAPDLTAPQLPPDVAEMVAREVERRMSAMLQIKAARDVIEAELPNEWEVDAETITSAVLTRQGYVVPAPRPDPRDIDLMSRRV